MWHEPLFCARIDGWNRIHVCSRHLGSRIHSLDPPQRRNTPGHARLPISSSGEIDMNEHLYAIFRLLKKAPPSFKPVLQNMLSVTDANRWTAQQCLAAINQIPRGFTENSVDGAVFSSVTTPMRPCIMQNPYYKATTFGISDFTFGMNPSVAQATPPDLLNPNAALNLQATPFSNLPQFNADDLPSWNNENLDPRLMDCGIPATPGVASPTQVPYPNTNRHQYLSLPTPMIC